MIIICDNQPLTRDALTGYFTGQPLLFAEGKEQLAQQLEQQAKLLEQQAKLLKQPLLTEEQQPQFLEKQTLSEEQQRAAVVILDFSLFNFTTPENFLIYLRRFPFVKWLLLSAEFTENLMRLLSAEQNVSFLTKDCTKEDVLHALFYIENGERYLCQGVQDALNAAPVNPTAEAHLTTTETAILSLIAQGLTARQIAEKRSSSVHTIITHKKNIFRKLGVSTAYEATRYALRAGIADPVEYYI